MKNIFWGKSGSAPRTFRGCVPVSEIVEIRDGKGRHKLCRIFMKDYSSRINRVFAIVCKNRILELEAPTIDSKYMWMEYFRNLH
jgi:hypothetical protein